MGGLRSVPDIHNQWGRWRMLLVSVLLLWVLVGCGGATPDTTANSADSTSDESAMEEEAVAVAVLTVAASPQTLMTELSGRVIAQRIAEVRPQVRGIVAERLFTEGSHVRKGDLLYRIEDDRYQAQKHQAQADLAIARAALTSAEISHKRYQQLVGLDGVSQHEYELGKAAVEEARAQVLAREAALDSAELDLQQTLIRAPVSGVISRAEVDQGALVSAEQSTPLARIQALDIVLVDLVLPARQLLQMRRNGADSGEPGVLAKQSVELILEDGHPYGHPGSIMFADYQVDQSTGMVTLRARFDNPDGLLIPGMFVRARLALGAPQALIAVPRQALVFSPSGQPQVWLVKDGKARLQALELLEQRPVDGQRGVWLVKSGLEVGEQVVTEGLLRLHPGVAVVTSQWPGEFVELASDNLPEPVRGSSP